MTPAFAFEATDSTPKTGPFAWLLDAIRTWRWQHSAYAVLLGMFTLSNLGGFLFFNAEFPWLRSLTYNVLQFGFPCVLWLRWADRAVGIGGWPAFWCYVPCAPVVACTGVWGIGWALSFVIGGDKEWGLSNDLSLISLATVCLALVAAACAYFQESQRAQTALRAEHEAREAQAQALSAAKLLALQARMEPQLLFDTLKSIRDQVGEDDAGADAKLLELISLLRAMQPHTNARSSTLGRELSLVQSYGRVAGLAALQHMQITCSDEARQMELAPLLLLPLLRELSAALQVEQQLKLSAAVDSAEQLRVELSAAPSLSLSGFDASAFAERLRQVHGAQASLKLSEDRILLLAPAVAQSSGIRLDDLSISS
jgi:hypothetical protein